MHAIYTPILLVALSTVPVLAQVQVTSAMRNAMWKGEIGTAIRLDTVTTRPHMYGLGPLSGLQGEIMLWDSRVYVSRVAGEGPMSVRSEPTAGAPFFVMQRVDEWTRVEMNREVNGLETLSAHIDSLAGKNDEPFAFRLTGKVKSATVHVVNLPDGAIVRSPDDAHKGIRKYKVEDTEVQVLGFFSRHHQAVFTHHDTFVHLHLMTTDGIVMGHLEEMNFDPMEMVLQTSVRFHN